MSHKRTNWLSPHCGVQAHFNKSSVLPGLLRFLSLLQSCIFKGLTCDAFLSQISYQVNFYFISKMVGGTDGVDSCSHFFPPLFPTPCMLLTQPNMIVLHSLTSDRKTSISTQIPLFSFLLPFLRMELVNSFSWPAWPYIAFWGFRLCKIYVMHCPTKASIHKHTDVCQTESPNGVSSLKQSFFTMIILLVWMPQLMKCC